MGKEDFTLSGAGACPALFSGNRLGRKSGLLFSPAFPAPEIPVARTCAFHPGLCR